MILFKVAERTGVAGRVHTRDSRSADQPKIKMDWDVKLLQHKEFRERYQEELGKTSITMSEKTLETSVLWELLAEKLRTAARGSINGLSRIPTSP